MERSQKENKIYSFLEIDSRDERFLDSRDRERNQKDKEIAGIERETRKIMR